MDFELKPLSLSQICLEKCDALIVLVPQTGLTGSGALCTLARSAHQAGDFDNKPGKLLSAYRVDAIERAV